MLMDCIRTDVQKKVHELRLILGDPTPLPISFFVHFHDYQFIVAAERKYSVLLVDMFSDI